MRLQKMALSRGYEAGTEWVSSTTGETWTMEHKDSKEITLAPNQIITSLGKNGDGELVVPIQDIQGINIFYLSLLPEDINRIYEFHKSSKKNTMYFT